MTHAPASFVGFAAEEESSAKEVRVSTVDEFLAAIAPNTTICMEAGTYDLTAATGYGKTDGDYYYWEECFDGHGLIINAVEGLSIIGAGADSTEISAIPRYANVLSFYNCSGLSLSGFTAGHTQEPGECAGGVIDLWYCIGVKIDSCGLYGCGVTGISAIESSDISVVSTEIYDCSYTPVQLSAVRNAVFENCSIRDCGNNNQFVIAPDCSDIKA